MSKQWASVLYSVRGNAHEVRIIETQKFRCSASLQSLFCIRHSRSSVLRWSSCALRSGCGFFPVDRGRAAWSRPHRLQRQHRILIGARLRGLFGTIETRSRSVTAGSPLLGGGARIGGMQALSLRLGAGLCLPSHCQGNLRDRGAGFSRHCGAQGTACPVCVWGSPSGWPGAVVGS